MDWSILSQVPAQLVAAVLLGAFVIYQARENYKQKRDSDTAFLAALDQQLKLMRDFWREQRDGDREVLIRLVNAVERVEKNLNEHDDRTSKAITMMDERTRPTRRVKQP